METISSTCKSRQHVDDKQSYDLARVLIVATMTEGSIGATSNMYEVLVPYKLIDVAAREKKSCKGALGYASFDPKHRKSIMEDKKKKKETKKQCYRTLAFLLAHLVHVSLSCWLTCDKLLTLSQFSFHFHWLKFGQVNFN